MWASSQDSHRSFCCDGYNIWYLKTCTQGFEYLQNRSHMCYICYKCNVLIHIGRLNHSYGVSTTKRYTTLNTINEHSQIPQKHKRQIKGKTTAIITITESTVQCDSLTLHFLSLICHFSVKFKMATNLALNDSIHTSLLCMYPCWNQMDMLGLYLNLYFNCNSSANTRFVYQIIRIDKLKTYLRKVVRG